MIQTYEPKSPSIAPGRGEAIIEYIRMHYYRLFEHKSGNTRRTYEYNARPFARYIEVHGFTADVVEKFANHLRGRTDIKRNTKSAYSAATRTLLERVNHFREDLLPFPVLAKLIKYADWERERNTNVRTGHTPEEVAKIKTYLDSIECGYKRTRLKAMFVLMALQGLRASEVIRIRREDYGAGVLNIIRKGGKTSQIPLFDSTILIIEKYIRFHGIESGYLFTSRSRNQQDANPHIRRDSLHEIWKGIFQKLGIVRSIHDFRHYLATKTVDVTNGNTFDVKAVLGHESVTTSQRYVDDYNASRRVRELSKEIKY